MTRLEEDYKLPENWGGYMKFKQGNNAFRILSKPIIWWEYFNKDNKPQRFEMDKKPEKPTDIKEDGKVKHFWAFVVYNYQTNWVEILEITQTGIMKAMKEFIDNAKRGDPAEYDFIVKREWEGLETEYTVSVNPKESISKDVEEAYKTMSVNLDALFDGEDPFQPVAVF